MQHDTPKTISQRIAEIQEAVDRIKYGESDEHTADELDRLLKEVQKLQVEALGALNN